MAKRRIRIVNETGWQTRDLRRFVVRAARDYGPGWSFTVRFYPARTEGCAGLAYLGGSYCQVGILNPGNITAKKKRARARAEDYAAAGHEKMAAFYERRAEGEFVDRASLAKTIAHELAHLRGVTHKDMNRSHRELTWRGAWRKRFAWAEGLPLRPKAPPAKKPRPAPLALAQQKLAHAERKLAEWEAKKKRAETGIRSWRRKAAYHRRRAERLAAEG